MPETAQLTEPELLEQGLALLDGLVGPNLEFVDYNIGAPQPLNLTAPLTEVGATRLVSLRDTSPGGSQSLPVLVEVKRDVSPAMLDRQVRPQVELMRRLNGDAAVLIISPWLSPRTREVLDQLGYSYVDLTGNVSFRLTRPAVVLRLQGDKQNPSPRSTTDRRQLRGPKAGRLVRAMVDVPPPYQAADLAQATGLSAPYVSRLLDTMEDQAFIERSRRQITGVDWQGLIRARAESYELLKANETVPFLAPAGADAVMSRLKGKRPGARVAVTGPLAARSVAPIAIGGQLMIYIEVGSAENGGTQRVESLRTELGLLRTEAGADVLFLLAEDPIVFAGTRKVEGVPHASLSQVAIDSLGGPGRMPVEGEELLNYMAADLGRWQQRDLELWAKSAALGQSTHLQGA